MGDTEYRLTRKLHEQSGSLLVALPRFWARANGLEDKSEVLLVADGVLEVRPSKRSRRSKSSEAAR